MEPAFWATLPLCSTLACTVEGSMESRGNTVTLLYYHPATAGGCYMLVQLHRGLLSVDYCTNSRCCWWPAARMSIPTTVCYGYYASQVLSCYSYSFLIYYCSPYLLRAGYILCQAWARIPTPENQKSHKPGAHGSVTICYCIIPQLSTGIQYGCLHQHVDWQFA